eukprot:TRINITY_DN6493_c0_g1_i2.p1 TRINITY_DN6493_c0_g1~~TRINITY_DN6493_c0_g1_i2.p1  ORF type:complete len:806 (+),score=284.11 TRINITY_DN6493_c0_g1_i2:88-2418(+)
MLRFALLAAAATAATAAADGGGARKPQKVAVLGTGLGATSAVWYMTDYEGWEQDWDITVYTLGFKMGGRGAATRSMGPEGMRIREHGLHIFMGWYNNAFRWVEDMYAQWKPSKDCPLQKWQDAFKPSCNAGVYVNRVRRAHSEKPEYIPLGMPGGLVRNCTIGNFQIPRGPAPSPWALWLNWVRRMEPLYQHRRADFAELLTALDSLRAPPDDAATTQLISRLEALQRHYKEAVIDLSHLESQGVRVPGLVTLADAGARAACVGMAIALGVLRDGMLKHGFAVANGENSRDWIHKHGCPYKIPKDLIARTGADLTFAYVNGVAGEENFNSAVGTAIPGLMLIGHMLPLKNDTYFSQAVFMRMQAGMSETLITPAYEVLKRRGVKFNFFHKVEDLVTTDGSSVDEIKMRVQATVKGGPGNYEPFFKVNGLPVTPDLEQPAACTSTVCQDHLGQLEEADEIRRDNINLNSFYGGWVSNSTFRTLRKGTDYDVIVNGIAASLPFVSKQLAEKSKQWSDFVTTTKSDATQAFQVWWYNTTHELGCGPLSLGCSGASGDSAAEGTLCAGAEPFDTWADMTHLLPKETANASYGGGPPKAVHYWCGPQEWDTSRSDFANKSAIPAAFETVFENAANHLENHMKVLFPEAYKKGRSIYDFMVAPEGVKGRDRLRHQYWRSNADPSEQYVLSLAGSINQRPSALGEGRLCETCPIAGNAFNNMVVVGDIARTGIDAGCAEAAVSSGLMASHSLTGGRSPATFTNWLAQVNMSDPLHLNMGGAAR